jgi:hypothetical protein
LIELKKRFENVDSLTIDSRGNFLDQEGFGECGIFIILKHVEQPLKYVSLDINVSKNIKKDKKSENKETSRFRESIRIMDQQFKEEQSINSRSEKLSKNLPTNANSNEYSNGKIYENRRKSENLEDFYNASMITTRSKQLHVVNAVNRNELFGFDDVLYEWSGDIFTKLEPNEMLFAKNLLNLPFGNQTSKDHGVLSLIKNLLGTKEMFLGWDLQGPFEFAELPNTFINEIFKKDFDSFFDGLINGVNIMEQIHHRIQKGRIYY